MSSKSNPDIIEIEPNLFCRREHLQHIREIQQQEKTQQELDAQHYLLQLEQWLKNQKGEPS